MTEVSYVVVRPSGKIVFPDSRMAFTRYTNDPNADRIERWTYTDEGVIKEDATSAVIKRHA